MIPQGLLPILHMSSFRAWETLSRVRNTKGPPSDTLLVDGYSMQSRLLATSCEAVMNRALKERVSLILEGVHVEPGLLQKVGAGECRRGDDHACRDEAGTAEKADCRQGGPGPGAAGQALPEAFPGNYWSIQSHLLAEADRCQVPIVVNDNKDLAMVQKDHENYRLGSGERISLPQLKMLREVEHGES